jgi:hypothetical protein
MGDMMVCLKLRLHGGRSIGRGEGGWGVSIGSVFASTSAGISAASKRRRRVVTLESASYCFHRGDLFVFVFMFVFAKFFCLEVAGVGED